jgi:DNA-binding transcriptional MerR regulator
MNEALPPIPAKRYFTIGEVAELCGVKTHVLRYWEQEFTQLRPVKRRGNRRYYQHHEVLMIRRIRDLLYEQGFTISGARNRLQELVQAERAPMSHEVIDAGSIDLPEGSGGMSFEPLRVDMPSAGQPIVALRQELQEIRSLLTI